MELKLKNLKNGFAVVLYGKYNRQFGNTEAIRVMNDKEEAIYNAKALSLCDKTTYSVFDCKCQKLIY